MAERHDDSLERQDSFARAALPHLDSVYRGALAMTGKTDEAEDLTQATFMKALERFETFRPGTRIKPWLLQILRNLWIDRLRHAKVAGTTVPLDETFVARESGPAGTAWSDAEDLLENFSDEQVIRALQSLPQEQRLTLYLVDVEELSHAEVAEITDVAVGTVKSRTSRARTELKRRLSSHAGEMRYKGATDEPPDSGTV